MLPRTSRWFAAFSLLPLSGALAQGTITAARITPNLATNIDRPLRYRPDGADFVIVDGPEYFNRSLYGGNTAFRVDGGDEPEFVLYLPGRGGNLRLGLKRGEAAKWLQRAARIETRYRPGELRYRIEDPLLGPGGALEMVVVAYAATEGLGVRVEAHGVSPGANLIWAYGGINGQRGARDGDIGTERVPISQWFQYRPEFSQGNRIEIAPGDPAGRSRGFSVHAAIATIEGLVSTSVRLALADGDRWDDASALLGAAAASRDGFPGHPVLVGITPVTEGAPFYLSLQRVNANKPAPPPEELATYREVAQSRRTSGTVPPLLPRFAPGELPNRFAEAQRHFAALRSRVTVETPDPFLNAAVGALNVAGDAVWDEPQRAIMHGSIAWRTRLLGWRGPYLLDALGWHERFRENAEAWFAQQNTEPVSDPAPPAEEKSHLARNEAGLHTNGDISRSHYDMNLVFIDAVFRHLAWTGDLAFARRAWPVIVRHLAWERRLFRREYGPEKLPLYEAYAVIWASDNLEYEGGGAMHATAYNYFENRQAARLARVLGEDPAPYEREADLLSRSMRQLLWVTPATAALPGAQSAGWFAEAKDWLGLRRVHADAALWTFYHTLDSGVPTPEEAWTFADYAQARIPHLPVRGPGVPPGLWTLSESDWMPYQWSLNNVVMAEAVHGSLALWEAGRPDEAWAIAKGSVVAAMFMGISPGNVGSMSYLDVYRRESQRDFADGAGVLSRALVEGLFGIRPDALAGELRVTPGWPAEWEHARFRHPDLDLEFNRRADADVYRVTQRFPKALSVRLRVTARRDRVAAVSINGQPGIWKAVADAIGAPRIEVPVSKDAVREDGATEFSIRWSGEEIRPRANSEAGFAAAEQGQMRWIVPPAGAAPANRHQAVPSPNAEIAEVAGASFAPVDLSRVFNDRVTQIFRHHYRSPRSPFVSLALPEQGLGGWAGEVNAAANIDDSGLRDVASRGHGKVTLPNGVPFAVSPFPDAPNILFTSRWSNFPASRELPLSGHARGLFLLMAGTTDPMQSWFENGRIVVRYADGTASILRLVNPTTWWPIEQDYFIDDYQFRVPGPLPTRIDLRTGRIRELDAATFKGRGGAVRGGAATVLSLALDPRKELRSLTVEATANDVVIGLMAATLVRSAAPPPP